MGIEEAEAKLRETGRALSVRDLPDFPFDSYQGFLTALAGNDIRILSRYNVEYIMSFGSTAQYLLHLFLTSCPLLTISIASAGIAFATGRWVVLFSIPASVLGLLFTTERVRKSFGRLLWLFCVGLTAYFLLHDPVKAVAPGAYALSFTLACAARHQCAMLMIRAVIESEPLLSYLWLNGAIAIGRGNELDIHVEQAKP